MKRLSQFKLKKLILLFVVGAVILLYYAFPVYYDVSHVQAQQQQQQSPIMGIKITSPVAGQVPVGVLTISGISTDNVTNDCTVYADWNNTKPFQKAVATGKGGINDYSRWNYTYTDKYHLITNGTNNLTSKLSCINNNSGGGTSNLTTYYSLDITGTIESSSSERDISAAVEEQQNNVSDTVSSSTLPPVKGDNNNTKTTTATSPESIPSVPITPSPVPSSPSIQGQEEKNKDVAKEELEPEPQSTPSLTENDKTENTVKQTRKIEEVQEDEKVQEQIQQMLEKAGKTGEEVRQTVGKLKEDILEEIKNSLK
jgi:hypothetical protein